MIGDLPQYGNHFGDKQVRGGGILWWFPEALVFEHKTYLQVHLKPDLPLSVRGEKNKPGPKGPGLNWQVGQDSLAALAIWETP